MGARRQYHLADPAAPAYINPVGSNNKFDVKYDLTILPTQVDDIGVQIRVIDANNHVAVWTYDYIVAVTGLTAAQISPSLVPMASDGWYDLQVALGI